MSILGVPTALTLIAVVLFDSFEVMLLPRRITHRFRFARLYFRSTWHVWRSLAWLLPAGKWRYAFLSVFGPISLLALLALWGTGLIIGFGLLHWSLGAALAAANAAQPDLATCLYFSGTTFVTLGYGDVVPTQTWSRALSVAEAGVGFGFLAIMISYLPVLYQAFSRREIIISLLDARAGSPPSAGELLRRIDLAMNVPAMQTLLVDWERWAAELLESQASFPALSYYRSQHDNQSWVATLTVILDTAALMSLAVESPLHYQARLTFAMARHAAVDLAMVYQTPPIAPMTDRLSPADYALIDQWLTASSTSQRDNRSAFESLGELRSLYEPFALALGNYFQFAVPAFVPSVASIDNWQTSRWLPRAPHLTRLPATPTPLSSDVH